MLQSLLAYHPGRLLINKDGCPNDLGCMYASLIGFNPRCSNRRSACIVHIPSYRHTAPHSVQRLSQGVLAWQIHRQTDHATLTCVVIVHAAIWTPLRRFVVDLLHKSYNKLCNVLKCQGVVGSTCCGFWYFFCVSV